VLKHVEGYNNNEIAQLLGTSRGAVAVMLFRARIRLKKAILLLTRPAADDSQATNREGDS